MDEDLVSALSTGCQAYNGNAFNWTLVIREDTHPEKLNLYARYGLYFFKINSNIEKTLDFFGFGGSYSTRNVWNAVGFCFERRGWAEIATDYKEFDGKRRVLFEDGKYRHTATAINRGEWIELQHYREEIK